MRIIIDDFGLDEENDLRILSLVSNSKLFFGVSCVVLDGQKRKDLFNKLAQLNHVKIGLHFILTNFDSSISNQNRFPSFLKLATCSLFSIHKVVCVESEFKQQIELFVKTFGRFPDFIDGHQHIQQLPVIRKILIQNILKFKDKLPSDFFVRNSALTLNVILPSLRLGVGTFFKNIFLGVIGCSFKRCLLVKGISTNSQLLGTYANSKSIDFSQVYRFYKNRSSIDDLFYCHPGIVSQFLRSKESSQPSRELEFQYFIKNLQASV